jgi:hypothetical protein
MTTLARALSIHTANAVVRCLRSATLRNSTLVAILALAGCTKVGSREFYEVNKDRERMRHGESLKYHKDPIELSQHAMDLRMGVQSQKGKPSKVDLYGEGSQLKGGVVPAGASYSHGEGGGVQQAGGFYPGSSYPGASPSVYYGAQGRTAMEYSGPDPTLK